jgi:hypothetical protein
MQGDANDDGNYFFFSAPASPVHYILRSPPSSTATFAAASIHFAGAPADDADCYAAAAAAGDDFEFAAHGPGGHKGGVAVAMSSAEELFVAGRIRVNCLSPIRQEDHVWEECGGDGDDDDDEEWDGRSPRATTRRARSASPTRSPRGATAEPSVPFASASSSSSSSSSSSAKSIRRRISLRDLLSRTGGDCAGADHQASSGTARTEVTSRLGFWPPSIWPSSRSSKKSPLPPCPASPQPGRRRSTSSDRGAVPTATKRAPGGGSGRRTTSLPYRQGLVLGCLGFGARGYGLAKSMHPLPSR